MSDELRSAVARKGSVLQTVKAVLWSFLGIRRAGGLAEDVQQLNPVHVILVGVGATAVFVWGVLALVRWIVGSGVAA